MQGGETNMIIRTSETKKKRRGGKKEKRGLVTGDIQETFFDKELCWNRKRQWNAGCGKSHIKTRERIPGEGKGVKPLCELLNVA